MTTVTLKMKTKRRNYALSLDREGRARGGKIRRSAHAVIALMQLGSMAHHLVRRTIRQAARCQISVLKFGDESAYLQN